MIWVLCCKPTTTGAFTTTRINNQRHGVLSLMVNQILKDIMTSFGYGFFIGVFHMFAIERYARHVIARGMVAMDMIGGFKRRSGHFNRIITGI